MPKPFLSLTRSIALAALLSLACNLTAPAPTATPLPTVAPTRTPRPAASPIVPPTEPPELMPTAMPAVTPTADPGALKISGGPTLASPAAAQEALNAGTPYLEFLAAEKYTPAELSQAGRVYTYTIRLEQEQPVLWLTGWCAADETILRDNYQHITLEFSVNGMPIDLGQFAVLDAPSGNHPCKLYYTVVRDWPQGQTRLDIKVTFAAPINDGINAADFPQGIHFYRYVVRRP